MKVLVTGATGFIGEWVMKELDASEHTAVAFSGDVRDKSTFPKGGFEVIIHLAAKVDKKFWESNDLYNVNVDGTKNLIEQYPDSRIVYISSADVEKEIMSKYAKTKKEPEKLVLHNPDNLVMRPPSIFGPGDTHDKLIPKLFKKYVDNGECDILNNDENEYMYVGDVAKHIVDNMDKRGIIRLRGFKVRNSDLDAMIQAVCEGKKLPNLMPEERHFFVCLEQCLYHHHEKQHNHSL